MLGYFESAGLNVFTQYVVVLFYLSQLLFQNYYIAGLKYAGN